jgi:hypothetical protein
MIQENRMTTLHIEHQVADFDRQTLNAFDADPLDLTNGEAEPPRSWVDYGIARMATTCCW